MIALQDKVGIHLPIRRLHGPKAFPFPSLASGLVDFCHQGSDPAFYMLTLEPIAGSLNLGVLQALLEWTPGCGLKGMK